MKQTALIVLIVALVGSLIAYMIIASSGWTGPEQDAYIERCVHTTTSTGHYNEEQANAYCTCMLEKTMDEFSSVEEAVGNLTTELGLKWRDECFESLNISSMANTAE